MGKIDKNEFELIEKQAKFLLISKEIPEGKKDIVSSLFTNEKISSAEKYSAIIELLKNCEDKSRSDKSQKHKETNNQTAVSYDILGPTETSYYIDSINIKYQSLKIFRKRFIAHKNNRFGIGIKKRLIPTKKLLKIFKELGEYQEILHNSLPDILLEIIRDPEIESPLIFNYLRLVRKWLTIKPFTGITYDSIKWMEKNNFDRELKEYIKKYFSFLKFKSETREEMILLIENKLRSLSDFKKYEISANDNDTIKKEKEKENYAREKLVYEYIAILRSFLPAVQDDNGFVSRQINIHYGVRNITELLLSCAESLIYQRPFTQRELMAYYEITAPSVSPDIWDYSEDFLKKAGKDPATKKRKLIESLKSNLEVYETIYFMVNHDDSGMNRLIKAVEIQWKTINKKKIEAEAVYEENFFNFLDALLNYFKNTFTPILNGTPIFFRDHNGNTLLGSVFDPFYFDEEMTRLNSLLNEMHYFKSNNPSLAISHKEVKKILDGQIKTMAHVESFVKTISEFFYSTAVKLQMHYDMHKKWSSSENKESFSEKSRTPVVKEKYDFDNPLPLPYSDCVITGFERAELLSSSIIGKKLIDETLKEGVIVDIISFAYQTAYECFNSKVFFDLDQRKTLIKRLKDLDV
jgi:hypothetical protein